MRRNTTDYISLMSHALGKTPDSRHKLIQTFNDAGRALVNAHPWSWRTRAAVTVLVEPGIPYANLPEDFGEVVSITVGTAQSYAVVQTSLADLARRRSGGQYDALCLFVAFEGGYDGPTDEDGVETNRMQLHPTQTTARDDITIDYRVKWVDMDESRGERVPLIPRDWERALVMFARSFAVDTENQISPYENEALFGPSGEIQRLLILDAGRQTNYGRPLANVLSTGRGSYYPHRRVSR